ncbi:hypothetical protein BH20ACT3_BH20ACT3_04250 [soil metagenome]
MALSRAWPRSDTHVLVELENADGSLVAGQWFADPAEVAAVVARTPQARALGESGLVAQPNGADHRLPALFELAGSPGARLLVHRPERRAVVRHPDGSGATRYTKMVRRRRVDELVAGLRGIERLAATGGGFAVPHVVEHRRHQASVTCTALPGESLFACGDGSGLARRWHAAGRAIAALHRGEPGPQVGTHDAAAEASVTLRWLGLATAHGLLDPLDIADLLGDLREGPPGPLALLHRDLHDKQLLVDEAGGETSVGVLDLDTLAVGERALDLANLLVHLELRVAQGRLDERRADRAADAFLAGAEVDLATERRLGAHATACRLRLAAVYAFRPRWRWVSPVLLSRAREGTALPG